MTPVTPDPPTDDGLPAALRRATVEVIIDKGLGAFSLREVARRAGVSHAAPGYHFGDLRGLLTSVAVEGLSTLHRELSAAARSEADPAERLTAVGQAYARVALQHPAHCEVMWREDLLDVDDAAYQEAGLLAYGVLVDTIRDIGAERNAELALDDAAKLCWSAMQGLVQLAPKLARLDELHGRDPVAVDEAVARFTPLLVEGMAGAVPGQASEASSSQRS